MATQRTGSPDTCDVACLHPELVQEARAALPPAEDAQELAAVFGVLADPTRVRLVAALAARELCVCDMANVVGLRQSTVSHQLRLLRALRVVRFRKEGRIAYYTLDDAHIRGLLERGLEHIRTAADRSPARRATQVA